MQYSIENDILRLTVDTHGAEAVSVIHKPTGLNCSGGATPLSGAAMRPFCSPTPAS